MSAKLQGFVHLVVACSFAIGGRFFETCASGAIWRLRNDSGLTFDGSIDLWPAADCSIAETVDGSRHAAYKLKHASNTSKFRKFFIDITKIRPIVGVLCLYFIGQSVLRSSLR